MPSLYPEEMSFLISKDKEMPQMNPNEQGLMSFPQVTTLRHLNLSHFS